MRAIRSAALAVAVFVLNMLPGQRSPPSRTVGFASSGRPAWTRRSPSRSTRAVPAMSSGRPLGRCPVRRRAGRSTPSSASTTRPAPNCGPGSSAPGTATSPGRWRSPRKARSMWSGRPRGFCRVSTRPAAWMPSSASTTPRAGKCGTRQFGGGGTDVATAWRSTVAGNVYVAGTTSSSLAEKPEELRRLRPPLRHGGERGVEPASSAPPGATTPGTSPSTGRTACWWRGVREVPSRPGLCEGSTPSSPASTPRGGRCGSASSAAPATTSA